MDTVAVFGVVKLPDQVNPEKGDDYWLERYVPAEPDGRPGGFLLCHEAYSSHDFAVELPLKLYRGTFDQVRIDVLRAYRECVKPTDLARKDEEISVLLFGLFHSVDEIKFDARSIVVTPPPNRRTCAKVPVGDPDNPSQGEYIGSRGWPVVQLVDERGWRHPPKIVFPDVRRGTPDGLVDHAWLQLQDMKVTMLGG